MGPNTDPCGTPIIVAKVDDDSLLNFVSCPLRPSLLTNVLLIDYRSGIHHGDMAKN